MCFPTLHPDLRLVLPDSLNVHTVCVYVNAYVSVKVYVYVCVCACVYVCAYAYLYVSICIYVLLTYTHIRRAFGPRRCEIRENNPSSFNPLRGLPPPIILPLGGPGAKSWCVVE